MIKVILSFVSSLNPGSRLQSRIRRSTAAIRNRDNARVIGGITTTVIFMLMKLNPQSKVVTLIESTEKTFVVSLKILVVRVYTSRIKAV